MIWFIVILTLTQILMVIWLFWLDQQFKLLNRYVQGLKEPYEHPMAKEPGKFA